MAAAPFGQMSFSAGSSVSCRRAVSLKCAGWLPQDGTFESELASGSRVERDQLCRSVIAHSFLAGHSRTLAAPSALPIWTIVGCGKSGMTASDQHQPASSRAIATLAITGRFLRASKPAQRACRRRLADRPRASPSTRRPNRSPHHARHFNLLVRSVRTGQNQPRCRKVTGRTPCPP